MSWFDSHCHLKTFWEKGELSAVIQRAQNASVLGMVTVGTSPKDWNIYSHLATEYQEMVYYSIGLHPGYVDEYWEQNTKGLRSFWDKRLPPVAFGVLGFV
ncbi:MAG: TatD family hydrolase [Verrucomicrobiota bacterium]|nr:TatD family hydrolase [Verrucomicrobiota bacterium]